MIAPDPRLLEPPVTSRWIATLLRPAPDSSVADNLRRGKPAWADAVHLLWTGWVFFTPIFGSGYSWRWFWLTLLTYPVFLALYGRLLLAPRHHGPRYALAMVTMGLALLPWYPSGISYFIFGCVMLRTCRDGGLWRYLLQLLALNALFVGIALWVGYQWQLVVWIPSMALIIGIIINVESLNKERDAALQLSQEEVRRLAATAERERIGRDLHDLLGHTLSLITLKLELSRKLFDRDPDASRREVAEAEAIARQALAEVRSAVTGIRASDLAAELASARLLLECQHVHLHYTPPPPMPVEIERALSLVLREAATNIARHAQAHQAWVHFEEDGRSLLMQIRDDGRGGVQSDGNGLSGMRERVAALRGTLHLQSVRGEGTCLSVRIALPAATTAVAALPATPAGPTPLSAGGAP
ncbi:MULTISPECIES: sensor histidine kinase [Stenotrophomonas]|jgi:two-component system sensor histidine kinase DesK|uniref:sensor histidine kinase n=1 Tax=Stenotrophomonas TaxID=40323 RepID=UPI001290D46F|nr:MULTISPECIES: sensor histidine kinase [Stenotrophomonas]MBD3825494.1 sensor histidine kinase [Stenotrophomonas sp.]QIO86606.1 two-component sensor histidine kinase [Stenotrophomonas rhizophila]